MANLLEILAMAVLCFAIAVEGVEDEPAIQPPEPSYSENIILIEPEFPPEPSPGYFKFLDECAKKMTPECSEEIFGGMFNEEITLTKPCCVQLVDMGKDCHDEMVKMLLAIPELKSDASMALIKSLRIWNECSSHSVSPAQLQFSSPFLSSGILFR